MRGSRILLALATLLAVLAAAATLPGNAAVSKTFAANETYVFGTRTLVIEPFNENATGYREDGFLRIWRKGECREEGVLQTCLTSSSATQAVFEETSLAADVTATHTMTPTSTRAGTDVDGTITITNKGKRTARDATLTLTTIPPATFSSGASTETKTGTVSADGSWTQTYRLTRPDNGTATVTATLTYHDGNTTRTVTIANATATFTTPFTDKIGYDPVASVLERTLEINLTRVATNVTVRTTITLPPEAAVTGYSRALSKNSQRNELVDTETLNTSVTSYTVTYRLTDAPSEPITVTYRYEEGGESTRTFSRTLPLTVPAEGPAPAILFNATMLRVGEEGTFLVDVLNPRGGTITVESALVNETLPADGGPYRLVAEPQTEGLYSVFITYAWLDAFGRERTTNGTGIIDVYDDRPEGSDGGGSGDNEENGDGDSLQNASSGGSPASGSAGGEGSGGEPAVDVENGSDGSSTVTLTDPPPSREQLTLWIASGCAVGVLAGLYFVLRRFRDPVRRVETLLRRTVELRTALVHKRGPVTEDELERLAELEEHLNALRRELA